MKCKGLRDWVAKIQGIENQSLWQKAQILFNKFKSYVREKLKLKDETAMNDEQESHGSNVG